MTHDALPGTVDFKRRPYRGILAEVARELGIQPTSVSNGIRNNNTKVLALVTQKIKEREAVVAEFYATLGATQ